MNAETPLRRTALVWSLLLCAGLPGIAQAWDWRNDPLGTRPPVVTEGPTLPGDGKTIVCGEVTGQMGSDRGSDRGSPLTLERALVIALCNNPQLQSALASIQVQAAAFGEAKASYLPSVNASVGRTNDRTSFPDSAASATEVDMHTGSLTLNWRVWDGGGRSANERASKALLDAALSNHDAAIQKTLGAVATAYFEARSAQTSLQAQERHQALAEEALQVMQRKEARGSAAQTDTLQAATGLAKAKLEYSRAKGVQYKAFSTLLYSLGLAAGTPLRLPLKLESDVETWNLLEVGDLPPWIERARQAHPAIRAARLQRDSAAQKAKVVQSEGAPTLDFAMGYYDNGRPNQSLSTTKSQETLTSLTLNIPLFAGFANTYKYQGAVAQIALAAAQLQDVENQTLTEVVKAHADALAAQSNSRAAQALLDAAQAAMQSVRRKLDSGAADRTELLSAESALVDAQSEHTNARLALASAKLTLFSSAGSLRWAVLGTAR